MKQRMARCERCGMESVTVSTGDRFCLSCWIFMNQMKELGVLIGYSRADEISNRREGEKR